MLRPGGRFVANVTSPWLLSCQDFETGAAGTALRRSYFDQHVMPEDGGAVTFTLTYGQWIRTLRGNGLIPEDLVEPRPGPAATTSYTWYVSREWAEQWPAECLWVASKPAA